MQCPVCHSDTTPSLPRCTRCNARLDNATVRDASAPSPQPDGGPPAGSDPLGGPWQSSPWPDQAGNAAASPGEETTSLSPEPWNSPQPWGQMWEPPPPRRRSKALPYVLTGLGVWVLTVVALAIIFWPQGDDSAGTTPQQSAATVERPQDETGSGVPEPSATTAGADDARQQASQIDTLLSEMASTRGELGAVVSAGCDSAGLQRIRDQRQEQLDTAKTLQVDALPDGEALKDALTSALEISLESNDLYLRYAPGCPSDEDAEDVNDRATRAKSEVIGYWNAIASEYGLSTRDSGSI